jgi:hypothetical protein
MDSKDKKSKKKGKKRVGKDDRQIKNSRGEMVTLKEFTLEQTLESTTKSLTLYRERMEGFINTNEELQEMCSQQEQDAVFRIKP